SVFGYSFFVFFFQAEDGIRDFHVTGVQTCALPIYSVSNRKALASVMVLRPLSPELAALYTPRMRGQRAAAEIGQTEGAAKEKGRSEERRVGKEWRTRWGTKQ